MHLWFKLYCLIAFIQAQKADLGFITTILQYFVNTKSLLLKFRVLYMKSKNIYEKKTTKLKIVIFFSRNRTFSTFSKSFYQNNSKIKPFFPHSAEKRAAWRQARLKTLEQDAVQAENMIQTMHDIADDLTEKNEVKMLVSYFAWGLYKLYNFTVPPINLF